MQVTCLCSCVQGVMCVEALEAAVQRAMRGGPLERLQPSLRAFSPLDADAMLALLDGRPPAPMPHSGKPAAQRAAGAAGGSGVGEGMLAADGGARLPLPLSAVARELGLMASVACMLKGYSMEELARRGTLFYQASKRAAGPRGAGRGVVGSACIHASLHTSMHGTCLHGARWCLAPHHHPPPHPPNHAWGTCPLCLHGRRL